MNIKYHLVLVFLFVSAVTDVMTNRIRNNVIFAGLILGVVLFFSKEAAIGFVVPFLILFPLYRMGFCGAGDVKLMMLTGFYLGLEMLLYCLPAILVLSLIFIVAVGVAEKRKFLQVEIPFAVPVFLGVIPPILFMQGGFHG